MKKSLSEYLKYIPISNKSVNHKPHQSVPTARNPMSSGFPRLSAVALGRSSLRDPVKPQGG